VTKPLSASEIRERLDHPVIDVDGHTTEFVPALAEYLKEVGIGTDFNALFRDVIGSASGWYETTPTERQHKRIMKPPWWTRPMKRTRDRAAASFPRFLRSRMDSSSFETQSSGAAAAVLSIDTIEMPSRAVPIV
jgi:hypothetical protein